MNGKHLALIVEDDRTIAEELAEILRSLDCDSVIADNKRDALVALQNNLFCFILLDLEIKMEPDSIKGHTEHGNSLLREIRRVHADHFGLSYWLPVLIVSGFAREVSAAVDVMKDGANDIIHKPFIAREVSAKVRSALERSGRPTHNLCSEKPVSQHIEAEDNIILRIPGNRIRQRTRVMIGSRPVDLTDSSLKILLALMVAHEAGTVVHKRDLGASDDQGFKGISLLRDALKPALNDGVNIIDNHYHGNYSLNDEVTIGNCDTERLEEISDRKITELAKDLRRRLDARRPKV